MVHITSDITFQVVLIQLFSCACYDILFLIYFWAYIFYYLLGVLGCIRVGISYSFDRDRLHNSHEEKGVLFFWGVHGRLGDYCRPLVN